MSDVNELLKKVSAQLEKTSSEFTAKAEAALAEAKNSGQLSAETKTAVDKIATEFNALTEANKTLKSSLGELEQHVAQMPLQMPLTPYKASVRSLFRLRMSKHLPPALKGVNVSASLSVRHCFPRVLPKVW